MIDTTVGQLLIDEALPPDMRGRRAILDKKGVTKLLQEVADKYPDKYREISSKLIEIGGDAAYESGGYSFSLKDLLPSKAALKHRKSLERQIDKILDNPKLTPEAREKEIVKLLGTAAPIMEKDLFEESLAEGNNVAKQITSGAKGSPVNLRSLRGGDLLYVDHRDEPIPYPVLRSYSEGLTPAEYFAGSYGARRGLVDLKLSTARTGDFAKQLIQAAHRLVVTAHDSEDEPKHPMGIPAKVDDPDNEGALLAADAGPHKRNTIISTKVLADLKQRGIERILIRSPMVGGPPDGGVYARDAGVRERGGLPPIGDFIGIVAAAAVSEPLTQSSISSKHSGGVAGANKGVSGFKLLNQLVQVPKTFGGGAAHAMLDGKVERIEPAPQGGSYVTINNIQHYVSPEVKVTVKPGDVLEAGDELSDGIPNPAELVHHKGIGEGRRRFAEQFTAAARAAGFSPLRRNVELLARGLINHVHLTDEVGDYVPGDVVPYSAVAHHYQPRDGYKDRKPTDSIGGYLEHPVLHYTIGTRITPRMAKEMHEFGVRSIMTHEQPPPFESMMVRGRDTLAADPDWLTRFLGSNLEKRFLKGVHRGDVSDPLGTSYVPALSEGLRFGEQGKTKGFDPKELSKLAV